MLIKLRRLLRLGRREEGAAAVEFAIVLPVLMLLLAGFIEFGWGFYWMQTVTNASRAGARYAIQAKLVSGVSTPYTESEIQTLVKNNYGNDLAVTVNPAVGPASGDPRSVTVAKTMQWLMFGFLQNYGIDLPAAIQNKTTMTME
jgi:hypothetical protein